MLLKIFLTMLVILKSRKPETLLICFSFEFVTIEDICKEILFLDISKATQSGDILTKIIKNSSDIFF